MSDESVRIAQELARIARENDLAEIEYRGQDIRLRLTFEYAERTVCGPAPVNTATPWSNAGTASHLPEPAEDAEPASQASAWPTVTSPLAGVFYRSARPGAAAFCETGQTMGAGETLCIVEAMKLMNEIGAEVPMKIHRILVENGTVVESGQALFEYEPLG